MAVPPNNQRFYRLFFKALDRFAFYQRKNYPIKYIVVEDEGKSWYVSKEAYLKLFRLYNPWYLKSINDTGDDEGLIKTLSLRKKLGKDRYLKSLLSEEPITPVPDEVSTHIEESHQATLDPQRHIESQNRFAQQTEKKHLKETPPKEEPTPEDVAELLQEEVDQKEPLQATAPRRQPPRLNVPQHPHGLSELHHLPTNPLPKSRPLLLVMGVGVLFVIIFLLPMGGLKNASLLPPYEQATQTISSSSDELMSLTLKGPADCLICRILNGGEARYQISYTYKGTSPVNVEISGPVPAELELAKATDEGWRVESGDFKQTGLAIAPNTPRNFNLTLKPKAGKVDFSIQNYVVTATVIKPIAQPGPATAVVVPTENIPANDSSCNGTYLSGLYTINTNPLKNFGDPLCDFQKDKLLALLREKDTKEAAFWYWLVEYESSFSPLAYNGGAKDAAGAWGLFQMGRGLNGPFDHGDVAWQLQTVNAINLKNLREAQGVGFKTDKSYWHFAWPSYCNEYPSNCRNRPN